MLKAKRCFRWLSPFIALSVMATVPMAGVAANPRPAICQKVVLTGDVNAGQEWKATLGQGWVFRVLPIDSTKTPPGLDPYSGWDLVVDREQPAGFPDALLLATPPYDSINEREIGTTFGLRAQDAIGWNPHSFRFLISPQALAESQKLFLRLHQQPAGETPSPAPVATPVQAPVQNPMQRIMDLAQQSASGEFRILDARLTPGIADAAPFAENWALRSARTPHTVAPAPDGKATPLGSLNWIRFSITLWLPAAWKAPQALRAEPGPCSE
jgi:hypothetical protein